MLSNNKENFTNEQIDFFEKIVINLKSDDRKNLRAAMIPDPLDENLKSDYDYIFNFDVLRETIKNNQDMLKKYQLMDHQNDIFCLSYLRNFTVSYKNKNENKFIYFKCTNKGNDIKIGTGRNELKNIKNIPIDTFDPVKEYIKILSSKKYELIFYSLHVAKVVMKNRASKKHSEAIDVTSACNISLLNILNDLEKYIQSKNLSVTNASANNATINVNNNNERQTDNYSVDKEFDSISYLNTKKDKFQEEFFKNNTNKINDAQDTWQNYYNTFCNLKKPNDFFSNALKPINILNGFKEKFNQQFNFSGCEGLDKGECSIVFNGKLKKFKSITIEITQSFAKKIKNLHQMIQTKEKNQNNEKQGTASMPIVIRGEESNKRPVDKIMTMDEVFGHHEDESSNKKSKFSN